MLHPLYDAGDGETFLPRESSSGHESSYHIIGYRTTPSIEAGRSPLVGRISNTYNEVTEATSDHPILPMEVVPVDIGVYAKNLELNSNAREYIQKRFRRLERHLKQISDAKIEVHRTSARAQADRIVAQMTLTANGYTLRGQESGLNVFAAVDSVTDVMDRQIRRYKGKVYGTARAKKSGRAGSGRSPVTLATMEAEASEDQRLSAVEDDAREDVVLPELGKVVRTKRFPMKPLTVEDAILEMELLSHDFFFFRNVETDEFNVVYRRHNGDYGVIEPVLV